MTRFFSIAFALSLGLAVAACSKSSSDTPAPKTKTELLTGKDWLLTGATVVYQGQSIDAFSSGYIKDCDKDNVLRYEATNTYAVSEGALVCSPPDTETGTWALSADQAKLTQTPQGKAAYTADIVELTDASLKLSQASGTGSAASTLTLTFKKK